MLRRRNGRKDLNYILPCFQECGVWREFSAYTNYIILFTYILYILYIVHVFAGGRRLGPQDTDSQERPGRNGGRFRSGEGCARRLGPEVGSRPHP